MDVGDKVWHVLEEVECFIVGKHKGTYQVDQSEAQIEKWGRASWRSSLENEDLNEVTDLNLGLVDLAIQLFTQRVEMPTELASGNSYEDGYNEGRNLGQVETLKDMIEILKEIKGES